METRLVIAQQHYYSMRSYLGYTPINTAIFPDSYLSARAQFIDSASQRLFAQANRMTYACAGKAPNGENLTTDTLWIGSEKASRVLVLLAGTHGVEGFIGSAVMLDCIHLIASGQLILPEETAVLVVHALTPWGYAWLRRCDEDGVDLNRNGVDFSQPLVEKPHYVAFRNDLFSANKEQRDSISQHFEHQFGRVELEMAISAGQYTDPDWPFYGGVKPAHGRQVTQELMDRYQLPDRDLAVIDLHSGLGPYGYGEIICDHPPDSGSVRIAQNWYGDSVTLPALGTSSSVPKHGLMDYTWHAIMNERSCHVTLEFGTYSTDRLFDVLLRDHQLWAQSDNQAARHQHSKLMHQHFCPDDSAWKAIVLFRARQVISQALNGLCGQ